MTRNQSEQIARIIYNVFEHEEQIDPRTIALMFQHMGRVGCSEDLNEKVGDDNNSYNKGINLIEHVINNLLPVDCEAAMLLMEALICIDGADDE